mgnify:CR=1 FL=1
MHTTRGTAAGSPLTFSHYFLLTMAATPKTAANNTPAHGQIIVLFIFQLLFASIIALLQKLLVTAPDHAGPHK